MSGGANILLFGLAYKKNVGDTRESPSLVVTELIEAGGASVDYNDPFVRAFPSHASMRPSRGADRWGWMRSRSSATILF